jgi:hypothetical protein
VLEAGEAVPEEALMEPGRYSWLGKWPLAAVLEGTYGHHDEHMTSLREWLAEKK